MSQSKQTELIKQFVNKLTKLDPGERARFKRNAGNLPHESNRVLGLFYDKVLPPQIQYNEDWYFLVATLYPLEKERDTATPPPASLGLSLRQVRTEKNGNGLDRRVERLLDADKQQLPFQLRQAIHFLISNQGRVHWENLLADVLQWSYPERGIQKKWARDYFVKKQDSGVQPPQGDM